MKCLKKKLKNDWQRKPRSNSTCDQLYSGFLLARVSPFHVLPVRGHYTFTVSVGTRVLLVCTFVPGLLSQCSFGPIPPSRGSLSWDWGNLSWKTAYSSSETAWLETWFMWPERRLFNLASKILISTVIAFLWWQGKGPQRWHSTHHCCRAPWFPPSFRYIQTGMQIWNLPANSVRWLTFINCSSCLALLCATAQQSRVTTVALLPWDRIYVASAVRPSVPKTHYLGNRWADK